MYQFVIVALISTFLSALGTWKVQEWRYTAKEAQRMEVEKELTKLNSASANMASAKHETTKTLIATKYVAVTETIDNVITKIEYRDRVCFDDDGLRAHAGAVRLTGNTSELKDGLPTAAAP